jgi:hypothetical protein
VRQRKQNPDGTVQTVQGPNRALRHGKSNRPSDESVIVQGQPAIRLGIGPTEQGQKQRASGELEQRSANVYKGSKIFFLLQDQ